MTPDFTIRVAFSVRLRFDGEEVAVFQDATGLEREIYFNPAVR